MNFMTATEAEKNGAFLPARVGVLRSEGRIPDVQKAGNSWIIPEDATNPADARIKSGKYIKKCEEEHHA